MALRAAGPKAGGIPDPDEDEGGGRVTGLGFEKPSSIYEREDDYRRRRLDRALSPARNDAFAMGDKTPDARVRTYADIMKEQALQRELDNTMRNIADKKRKEAEAAAAAGSAAQAAAAGGNVAAQAGAVPAAAKTAAPAEAGTKRRRRWDTAEPDGAAAAAAP
jgi:splicing factor 3B subunit 1